MDLKSRGKKAKAQLKELMLKEKEGKKRSIGFDTNQLFFTPPLSSSFTIERPAGDCHELSI